VKKLIFKMNNVANRTEFLGSRKNNLKKVEKTEFKVLNREKSFPIYYLFKI